MGARGGVKGHLRATVNCMSPEGKCRLPQGKFAPYGKCRSSLVLFLYFFYSKHKATELHPKVRPTCYLTRPDAGQVR